MRYSSLRDGFGVDRSSPLPARLGFPRKRFQMASEEPWSLSAVATMKNRPQSRKNLFTRGSENIVAAPCVAPSLPSVGKAALLSSPIGLAALSTDYTNCIDVRKSRIRAICASIDFSWKLLMKEPRFYDLDRIEQLKGDQLVEIMLDKKNVVLPKLQQT